MKIGVIGLGLAGLSIAKAMAEAGHDVVGFEQFGLIHENGSSHGDTRIYRRIPYEGVAYVTLAEASYPIWQDWNDRAGGGLFSRCGGLDAGGRDSAEIQNAVRFSEDSGLGYELIDGRDLAGRFPFFRIPEDWAAVYQPLSGYICPDAVKRYMHDQAVAAGAVFHFGIKLAVESDSGPALVVDGTRHDFDYIFVTAGAWLPELLPHLSAFLKIERQVLGWYKPLDGIVMNMPVLCAGEHFYGMPTPSGHFKIGMMHHLHEEVDAAEIHAVNEKDRQHLDAASHEFLNHFQGRADQYKTCLFTNTPDDDFIIDRHPDRERVIIFSCCSGHGAKYAPVYGGIALDMIQGKERPELDGFRLSRLTGCD